MDGISFLFCLRFKLFFVLNACKKTSVAISDFILTRWVEHIISTFFFVNNDRHKENMP